MKHLLIFTICCISLVFHANGQKTYPPSIEGAREFTYKTVDGTNLNLWIFSPEKHVSSEPLPAIVFFFGGGWNAGSPVQFVKHCEYLAARGMVAIVADYRVKSRHGVLAKECVADAKSAMRWIRENSSKLGIDSTKIAAGGGSAGGHLAAATAMLPKFDTERHSSISSKPNALVLFNPALVLAQIEGLKLENQEKIDNMGKRMGTDPRDMSPYHNIEGKLPPTIIFHGIDDTTVPFESVKLFTSKMNDFGNNCKLVAYEGEKHGFFNYGRKSNAAFVDTVYKMDKFLSSLGYLKAVPPIIVSEN